jgi:hypothetical protein
MSVCLAGSFHLSGARQSTLPTVSGGKKRMEKYMTKNEDNIVPVEEFWQRKVDRLHTLFDYERISKDEYVEGLVRLGFQMKDILESLEKEE